MEPAATDASDAGFVGDTIWDMKSAARAGVRAVAVLCGGIPRTDLEAAGSAGVHDGPADLLAGLDTSVFAQKERTQCCCTGGPAGRAE
ncbi:HAD hydrolase-like protein [Streptomyces aureus]|uniref:HAD hydrolase-like protein n=1 Tax=Streptomyces aureus TaxID=193461 RepID=A0ABV4STU0_9ACTN